MMNKLTKEVCEEALRRCCNICKEYDIGGCNQKYCFIYSVFNDLIKEHFELVEHSETYKRMCDNHLEFIGELEKMLNAYGIDEIKEKIEELTNIKPYKFEDLKEEMIVFDNKDKILIRIFTIYKNGFTYDYFGTEQIFEVQFEENRFFQVQKANEVLE